MGPTVLAPGRGLDVRPHPHINLATVTYLFDGEILHRDSLGSVQPIRPGAVNWMVAGSGIVHSERTPAALRPAGGTLFGIQSWIALPTKDEECAPSFVHYAAESLPVVASEGVQVRVIAGTLFGVPSPVRTLSEMIYGEVVLAPGARLTVPRGAEERAVAVVAGVVEVAGHPHAAGTLVVLGAKAEPVVVAKAAARVMILGGARLDGPRHVWWNFVSSSRERIEQAKADWRAGKFPPVPEETEFIPLPESPVGVGFSP